MNTTRAFCFHCFVRINSTGNVICSFINYSQWRRKQIESEEGGKLLKNLDKQKKRYLVTIMYDFAKEFKVCVGWGGEGSGGGGGGAKPPIPFPFPTPMLHSYVFSFIFVIKVFDKIYFISIFGRRSSNVC